MADWPATSSAFPGKVDVTGVASPAPASGVVTVMEMVVLGASPLAATRTVPWAVPPR
jgi:hypothetical protein